MAGTEEKPSFLAFRPFCPQKGLCPFFWAHLTPMVSEASCHLRKAWELLFTGIGVPSKMCDCPCGHSAPSPVTCLGYRAAREHELSPVLPPLLEQCLLIRLPQHQPLDLQEAEESPFSPDRGKAGRTACMGGRGFGRFMVLLQTDQALWDKEDPSWEIFLL